MVNIIDLQMNITNIQNKLRDITNSITRITERGDMQLYLQEDRQYPVVLSNTTFLVKRDAILTMIEQTLLDDAVTLNNYQDMLKRALEALDDSSGPT